MKNLKEKIKLVMKRVLLVSLLAISILGFMTIANEKPTYASAGHSVSHSGGSHSSHRSSSSRRSSSRRSSSSRSSRSSSSSYRSSGSGSLTSDDVVGIVAIYIVFMIIILVIVCSKKKSKPIPVSKVVNQEDVENEIKKYIPDFNKEEFLKQGFQTYCDVQNAWMNFRIKDVQDKITDELLNMFQSQLDAMEVKDEQNIIKDITYRSARLKSVSCQNDVVTVVTGYTIDMYDYIIKKSTGKVTSGTSSKKIRVYSEMRFRLTIDKNGVVDKCPNCGAKLQNFNGAGNCEYCGAKVVAENKKWVLTSERVERQEFIS